MNRILQAQHKSIEAVDPCLEDGFHAFEADDGIRWTDGDAVVPGPLLAGFEGPFEMVVCLGGSTFYPAGAAPRRAA
ncbi:MAG TPA: hypothetical protein VHU42_07230 [Rhodopila sp.]|nr:hypothetical protein [Rhodopila sp.]